MGSRPGGQVLRVHRAPHPGALNSQLCPWCRLRSSAQRSRASRSTSRASACSTAFQHTTPWPSAAAQTRQASARRFWNMGEYSGTGILFSTSEPHDTPRRSWPRGLFPAPSVRHRAACVTTARNGRCLGAVGCQDCLWPSDLAPPCPSTQLPDSCPEDFPSE